MPDSLEALDLLFLMATQTRLVRRDGIRFQGLRYNDPTVVAYVGETITIRYAPVTSSQSGYSIATGSCAVPSVRIMRTARSR